MNYTNGNRYGIEEQQSFSSEMFWYVRVYKVANRTSDHKQRSYPREFILADWPARQTALIRGKHNDGWTTPANLNCKPQTCQIDCEIEKRRAFVSTFKHI